MSVLATSINIILAVLAKHLGKKNKQKESRVERKKSNYFYSQMHDVVYTNSEGRKEGKKGNTRSIYKNYLYFIY